MRITQHCFRRHVERDRLDATIALYEKLEQTRCERRVEIPETRTIAAKVGQFFILAGDKNDIDKVRHVDAIFYVDDLDPFVERFPALGVEMLHAPREVTAGRNVTARHPDGLVVEYFEAHS